MPLYECIYYVRSNLPLSAVAQTMKGKAQVVLESGGVLRRLDNMGIMPLAYPMYRRREKHYKARWVYMLFDASPECVNDVQERLAMDLNVFRWVFYREKDAFRDKYDEVYAHFGVPRGQMQSEMREDPLTTLRRLNDVRVSSGQSSVLQTTSPLKTDSNTWRNDTNLANLMREDNPLSVTDEELYQWLQQYSKDYNVDLDEEVNIEDVRRSMERTRKEVHEELEEIIKKGVTIEE